MAVQHRLLRVDEALGAKRVIVRALFEVASHQLIALHVAQEQLQLVSARRDIH
jgi:hypothetical protein